jgi:hypothetical protein
MDKNGFLEDKEGNRSSKRLAGFVTLAGLFAVLAVVAIQGGDMSQFAWPLVTLAGALFGVGVLEKK